MLPPEIVAFIHGVILGIVLGQWVLPAIVDRATVTRRRDE
jgi:hypothetical protein